MTAKITLYGFYKYFINKNQNLFDRLILPDGIDKTVFIDSLVMKAGEFEVVFSDPEFMREAVGVWGKKWNRTFEKWIEALNIEYAPLENYDRHEDWTEDEGIDEAYRGGKTETETEDNTVEINTTNNTDSTNSGTNESINTVSAFNSSSYEPDNKNNSTNSDTSSVDTTGTSNTDEDKSRSLSATDTYNKDNDRNLHRVGRTHGNIGVTTSQQMLESELEIDMWNLYEHMSDVFINEFCIPVY